ILRVPGQEPGIVREEFVSLLDATATILDLAGLETAPAVDSRSLLPLTTREEVPWQEDIVCDYRGHHFPYPQRILRTARYTLVVNPESVCELYDLDTDPHEMRNRYRDPELDEVRRQMSRRLYELLVERGDNFYHWMTSMYDIGEVSYDPMMSGLDETTYQQPSRTGAQE